MSSSRLLGDLSLIHSSSKRSGPSGSSFGCGAGRSIRRLSWRGCNVQNICLVAIIACVLGGSMAKIAQLSVEVQADQVYYQGERESWALLGVQIPDKSTLLRNAEETVNEATDNIAAELEWIVKESNNQEVKK